MTRTSHTSVNFSLCRTWKSIKNTMFLQGFRFQTSSASASTPGVFQKSEDLSCKMQGFDFLNILQKVLKTQCFCKVFLRLRRPPTHLSNFCEERVLFTCTSKCPYVFLRTYHAIDKVFCSLFKKYQKLNVFECFFAMRARVQKCRK